MSKTTKRFAIGALVAGAAGYIAGILTAPKSGKETRDDIKNAAQHGMAEAERRLKQLHTQLAQVIDEAKEKLGMLKGKAQIELTDAIEKSRLAKEKARQILSAIHEDGGTDDKELKRAIEDANKAIDHLRAFLKKS